MSTVLLVIVGLGGVCVLEWPLSGWRLAVVAATGAALALVFAIPFAREFFALVPISAQALPPLAAVSALTVAAIAANKRWGFARQSIPRDGRE